MCPGSVHWPRLFIRIEMNMLRSCGRKGDGWGGGAPRGGSANTGRLDCRPHASHFPLYTALDLTVVYRFLTDHLEELVGGW